MRKITAILSAIWDVFPHLLVLGTFAFWVVRFIPHIHSIGDFPMAFFLAVYATGVTCFGAFVAIFIGSLAVRLVYEIIVRFRGQKPPLTILIDQCHR
jgi:hypothetical protein